MKYKSFVLLCLLLTLVLSSCSDSGYDPTRTAETVAQAEDKIGEHLQAIEEPTPPDTTISFAACGDNIMYYGTIRDGKKCAYEGGREHNFAPIYENIKHIIEGADIAFINQESPMAGEGYELGTYPHFNSPQDLAYDLLDAGYDVVNIANNHMLDTGSEGLLRTIEFWNTLPVVTLGGYLDEEDCNNMRVVEREDVKIGFLSYTYSTNGYKLKSGYDIFIPYIDETLIETQIKAARERFDLVFVSIHWGNENNMKQSESQSTLAKKMADWGADVILGHHPHVLQPIEWIEREGGGRTLCIYSLGNFVAEMPRDYNLLGGIMTFDIVRRDGELSIENPILIPTMYYYNKSFYKNSVHLLENFTSDMAKSIGLSYYGQSTNLDRLYGYLEKTISSEFLKGTEQ